MLSSLYRVWAKVRLPLVRAWSARVPRQYFAAGVGKSTEDAISRPLLTAEAAKKHEATAFIIVDMDKCYENVNHRKLMEAGRRHDFPLVVLRLCLTMYRAARAIAWNGVFSSFVFAQQTVVLGCTIALWLVQLLMISSLDDMYAQLPRQVTNVEVYVDDVRSRSKVWQARWWPSRRERGSPCAGPLSKGPTCPSRKPKAG